MASDVSSATNGAKEHDEPRLNVVREGVPAKYFTCDNGVVGLEVSVTLE